MVIGNLIFFVLSCQLENNQYQNEIFELQNLESRAATAENSNAEKGKGGMVADGIKGSPAIKDFKVGTTEILLLKKGSGMIRHLWCTTKPREPKHLRNLILRMYWENHEIPSVEVPLSDFFGVAHGASAPMYSKYIYAQEGRGYNCFFPMPFSEAAKITITNESDIDLDYFFYQIDFTLGDVVTKDQGRFHASFRRENPSKYGRDFKILETNNARGIYLGCIIGIRPLLDGWWGEGEVKIYLDGDNQFPTICGTGIEDYIGSAWGLSPHNTPVQGAPLVTKKFASLYRFHIYDPVYFQKDIKVTVQQMGSTMKQNVLSVYGDSLIFSSKNHPRRHPDDGYYLRSDDVCATAYWYQWPLIESRESLPDKELRSEYLYIEENQEKLDAEL